MQIFRLFFFLKNYYLESLYRWYHIFHVSNLIKNDCTEFSTTGDCLIRPCLENSWLINFEFQFLVVGLLILICFLRWQNIAVGIIFFLLLVNTSILIILATVGDVSAAHNIRNIFPKIQAYYWNNFQIVSILIELTSNKTCVAKRHDFSRLVFCRLSPRIEGFFNH